MICYLKLVILLLAILQIGSSAPTNSNPKKQLLYILLDGFRYDYVDRQPESDLPGFNMFLKDGVRAEYMTPIFPSVSFPDWTTLVTGLYAESHGIVGNHIYDFQEDDFFTLHGSNSTNNPKWWKNAEPIWSTATKAGISTAVIFMGKCNIPFDGVTPDYCEPFTKVKGYDILNTNMNKGIQKLKDGYEFVLVYNEYPDNVGHESGPESEGMDRAVREIDSTILDLQKQLEANNLAEKVNVVIVSDHGMVNTLPGEIKIVELDEYLPLAYVQQIIESGAWTNIKVVPGHINEVYERLQKMPGVEVYKHEDIPERLHYKNHKFIYDIVIKANIDTWIMASRSKSFPERSEDIYRGNHGYDNIEEKMRAIFFAKGPNFKSDAIIKPIQNVDVYPLLAHLLSVEPNPNNGTLSATADAIVADVGSSATLAHFSKSLWMPYIATLSLYLRLRT